VEINAIDILQSISGSLSTATTITRAYYIAWALTSFLLCNFRPRRLRIWFIVSLVFLSILMITFAALMLNVPTHFWTFSQLIIAASGFFSALAFWSTVWFSSQFGPSAEVLVSSGNGCSGIIASGIRILTKSAFPFESQKTSSSTSYFILCALVLLIAFLYFSYRMHSPDLMAKLIRPPDSDSGVFFSMVTVETMKIIGVQLFSTFLNWAITLSLFPGYLTGVPEVSEIADWTPIVVTTLFCVFDWLGRYLGEKWLWPSRKYSWATVVLRLLFYPIFVVSIRLGVDLGDPLWTFFWVVPFAASHGYSGTVITIAGLEHEGVPADKKETASFLMSLAILVGISAAMGLTFAMPDR
jgi:equilibrative nucleoside transporter 1/2/3